MEHYILEHDIALCCLKAGTFPEGIHAAQQKLAAAVNRYGIVACFGISYLYDGAILYMAAVALKEGLQDIPAGCTSYNLRQGKYISIYITDFAADTTKIDKAFKELLAHPAIDKHGCCAECYFPEGSGYENARDVRCMVRLAD